MEVLIARLEPGATGGEEDSTHPGEECILILEGKMKITIGEETYYLEEGIAFIILLLYLILLKTMAMAA